MARSQWPVAALLAGATAAAYSGLWWNQFITYDDPVYVTDNPVVRQGLSGAGLRWAFTTGTAGNWHPLTWISHMLDVTLFGLAAGPHHLMNLAIHIVNVVLLFVVLQRMTGARTRSALVAALFALHPLHVESVAWIAERKDLLSTTFLFLALGCYVGFVRRPSAARYAAVAGCFLLGLLCKPMIVTFPFLLLLLDHWPLRRTADLQARILEKVPLFALSTASSIATLIVQHRGQTTASLDAIPFLWRIGNALVAYARYIGATLWPAKLAVLYPHPGAWPALLVGASALALTVASVQFTVDRMRRPALFTGWFWFLGLLVPTIGLVQVGLQAMADRYTYVPLVGLFLMAVWGIPEFVPRRAPWRFLLALATAAALGGLASATVRQVRVWRDSETLYRAALAVTRDNAIIAYNLANLLADRGALDEAVTYYMDAIRIDPDFAEPYVNLGNALRKLGRPAEALAHYRNALRIEPGSALALNDLGLAYEELGRNEDAIVAYQAALRVRPDYAGAFRNLARANARRGTLDQAVKAYRHALIHEPASDRTRQDLAATLAVLADRAVARGHLAEAAFRFEESARLGRFDAREQLTFAIVLHALGRRDAALAVYCGAVQREPALARIPMVWSGPEPSDEALERIVADMTTGTCPTRGSPGAERTPVVDGDE